MADQARIVITGGTGFLGRVLVDRLGARFDIEVIGRQTSPRRWDARTLDSWAEAIDGAFAVINLTGRTVDCRYNAKNRREVLQSRLESTRVVGQAIATAADPPQVWLNASSATLYPHSLDQDRTEDSELDPKGFSEDVCRQWEAELMAADTPRTRRIAMRITIAFEPERGGATDIIHRLVRKAAGVPFGLPCPTPILALGAILLRTETELVLKSRRD